MEQLHIVETPSPDLIRRLALFAQEEADWSTTPFDLSLVNGFFILMYHELDTELVAMASVSFFSTAWIGNVIVAKNHRRKGLASSIVRALQSEIQSRRPSTQLCLIASLFGQFVYPKLGFLPVAEVSLCTLASSPPPAPSSLCPVFPTEEQHDAAISLFQQSAGYSRRQTLQAIFRESRQCAVLIVGGKVVAAAWARFTSADGGSSDHSKDKSGVFLGPVVAEFPDYAISVCSGLLRMKETGQPANSCRGVSVLVQQKRGDDTEFNVFRSLGFVAKYPLQCMVKSSNTVKRVESTTHDFASQTPQYFALMGFDLG